MDQKVRKYVQDQHMIEKTDRVLAGVSGGADSICLLFVLLELQKELGFELRAVHVNHQILLPGHGLLNRPCFLHR